MTVAHKEMLSTASRELEDMITRAMKKVGGKNENSLCRYLPMKDGYMHHFTLRKMKHAEPQKLSEMIKTFIIDTQKPLTVPPKQRAARGSRKKKDQIVLTKADIDRILHMARAIGDKEVIRKLTPRKDLRVLRRELISSIRQNKVDQELWLNYVETVSQQLQPTV
jgi:SpoVK/Ycf46/Vps4 family AAA+-type ATPase